MSKPNVTPQTAAQRTRQALADILARVRQQEADADQVNAIERRAMLEPMTERRAARADAWGFR